MRTANIHHDLEAITMVAVELAKEHRCNYNISLVNPNENGEFSMDAGSTYEFLADSYFEKDRPRVKIIHKTDDLIAAEPKPTKGSFEDVYPEEHRALTAPRTFPISNPYGRQREERVHDSGVRRHELIADGSKPYVRGEAKVGRNDACTCGSGKKFKKCCGGGNSNES